MPKNTLLDTNTINVGELLGNGKVHRVPPYQRDYSWREEHLEDLWLDIRALMEDDRQPHYMGAVVLQGVSDREFLIIDGQQRIATLTIVALAVIKKISDLVDAGIDSEKNADRVDILRRTYIGDKDPKSLLYAGKLFLNKNNDEFFQAYLVQLREPPAPTRLSASNKLLRSAYQYFLARLSELPIAQSGEALASFLADVIARRLLFIQIGVADELSAYTVFETLNARGLELTATDLLKNYLFSLIRAEHDLGIVYHQWTRISNIVGNDKFPDFLRYYLNSRQRLVRKDRLFKTIKELVQDGSQALALLDDLEHNADLFVALQDSHHELWRGSREQKRYIREIRLFGVKQVYSLLMAAHRQLDENEFTRVLKLCLVISFRYNVICQRNPNDLESIYNDGAVKIETREIVRARQIFEALRRGYVADAEFENDFAYRAINSNRRKKLVRYILFSLEADLSDSATMRDFEDDPATIEHILPENPSEEWAEYFSVDIQDNYIYRFGNYTLLESHLNRDVGNGGLSEKRSAYSRSEYAMSRVFDYERWDQETLNRRQARLAERACHIWRVDFE